MKTAGEPPAAARWRRPPPGVLLRFLLLALIVLAALAAFRFTPLNRFLDREAVAAALLVLRQSWWAPLALLGLYLVVSPLGLPVSPLVFAGGAVFGVLWGWVYNFTGCLLGATVSFLLARALGREMVAHLAGEQLLKRVESLLERHGFWTLVRARFVPMPFLVVNFGAALAGVRLPLFLSSSVVSLAPSLVIYTYFGHALFTVATEQREAVLRNLGGALLLIVALTFLVPLRRAWKRRRYSRPGPPPPDRPRPPEGR